MLKFQVSSSAPSFDMEMWVVFIVPVGCTFETSHSFGVFSAGLHSVHCQDCSRLSKFCDSSGVFYVLIRQELPSVFLGWKCSTFFSLYCTTRILHPWDLLMNMHCFGLSLAWPVCFDWLCDLYHTCFCELFPTFPTAPFLTDINPILCRNSGVWDCDQNEYTWTTAGMEQVVCSGKQSQSGSSTTPQDCLPWHP